MFTDFLRALRREAKLAEQRRNEPSPECKFIYRSGIEGKRPTGSEAQRAPQGLGPCGDPRIRDAWHELGPQVCEYLKSANVKWTSINILRFEEHSEDEYEVVRSPPVILVGVKRESLSREVAEVAALGCEELLKKFELIDVEVAFREEVLWGSYAALEKIHGSQ